MQLPDFGSESSPTAHIWTLRRIESEITRALYHPSLGLGDPLSDASFHEWFAQMQERLNKWYYATRQSVSLSEKIEFYELHFHIQVLRLHRPSPRCAAPTKAMRKTTLSSCIAIIKEFSTVDRLGKLFYLWHAAHFMVEAGICLLSSLLSGMELGQDVTHLAKEDTSIVMRYVKVIPTLLRKVSRRWSNIDQHASVLEAICDPILEKLQQWSNGDGTNSEFDELKGRLNQLSPFSPFPSESPLVPDLGDQLYPTTEDTSAPTNRPIDHRHIDSSWPINQPLMEQSATMLIDSSGFDSGDALAWDFAGMDSEEVLAALLEGNQSAIIDNFAGSM